MGNIDYEREFDWDDEIENDEPEFTLLPAGDYDFTVTGFDRERHPGSQKLPPCNKAVIHIRIDAAEGSTTINHNLFLHSKCEGLLCAFFASIGQRRHGEKLRMNWGQVAGAKGRCKVGVREWVSDRDGETRQSNEIKKFYDKEEKPQGALPPTPGFKAGEF